ncbi:MAG: type IV pilus assembly protein PilP [Gammaproteobacteria bacterium]|jgi:type IV pilus assembly protein PilP
MRKAHTSNLLSRYSAILSRGALVCAASIVLTGCIDRDKSDLEAYAQQILAKKGTRIDELPPVEPYEVFIYPCSKAGQCVDPFEPFYKETKAPPADISTVTSGPKPNFDRNSEELESHSLDALRMMGTVELNSELWGIVRSPDGTIHRVQVGNYVGRNHGKIIGISEESIDLNEIVDDGRGGYQERTAALGLSEQ